MKNSSSIFLRFVNLFYLKHFLLKVRRVEPTLYGSLKKTDHKLTGTNERNNRSSGFRKNIRDVSRILEIDGEWGRVYVTVCNLNHHQPDFRPTIPSPVSGTVGVNSVRSYYFVRLRPEWRSRYDFSASPHQSSGSLWWTSGQVDAAVRVLSNLSYKPKKKKIPT